MKWPPSTTTRAIGAYANRCRASTTWARASRTFQVWNVNLRGDRSLTLRHFQHNDRPLHETANEVLKHVARLWGFGVHMESVNVQGDVTNRWHVPAPVST